MTFFCGRFTGWGFEKVRSQVESQTPRSHERSTLALLPSFDTPRSRLPLPSDCGGTVSSRPRAECDFGTSPDVFGEFYSFFSMLRWLVQVSDATTILLEARKLALVPPENPVLELRVLDYDNAGVEAERRSRLPRHLALGSGRLRANKSEHRPQTSTKTRPLQAHGGNSRRVARPSTARSARQSHRSRLGKLVVRQRRRAIHGFIEGMRRRSISGTVGVPSRYSFLQRLTCDRVNRCAVLSPFAPHC